MYLQTCMHACIHPYRLGVDHPEHPDSFGRGWEGPAGGGKAFSVSTCPRNERAHVRVCVCGRARARTHTHTHTHTQAMTQEEKQLMRKLKRQQLKMNPSAVRYGPLSTHGLVLSHSRLAPVTTSTPAFRGSIDHMWHAGPLQVVCM